MLKEFFDILKGILHGDLIFYVAADGVDAPATVGDINTPFRSIEYIVAGAGASLSGDKLDILKQITLINTQNHWNMSVTLTTNGKYILKLENNIFPTSALENILNIAEPDITIIGGIYLPYDATQSQQLIMIGSTPQGMSAIAPLGGAYRVKLVGCVFQNMPGTQGQPATYVPAVVVGAAGADSGIISARFYNDLLALVLMYTGDSFNVEGSIFDSCAVAVYSDRRLISLGAHGAIQMAQYPNMATLLKIVSYPRAVKNCIFNKCTSVMSDFDYMISITGQATAGPNGAIITITGSDLSQVTTDIPSNYYPVAANELVGAILVDSNFDEYDITANDAFAGVYPFTITVAGIMIPAGPAYYIKAVGQDTYMIGNVYMDQQTDSDNDGVADVAGLYPQKGYGNGKAYHPDPMPMMASMLDIDRAALNPAALPGALVLMPDNKVLITTAVQNKLTKIVRGDTPQISFDLGFDCTGWDAFFGAKVSPSDLTYAINPVQCVWTNQALGQGYAQLAATDTAVAGQYAAEVELRQGTSRQTPLKIKLVILADVVS